MWFRVILAVCTCALVACSFGTRQIDSKLQDEEYDFGAVRQIGFVPDYSDWLLRGIGSRHLEYDPIYSCFESSLGSAGYSLVPLPVAEWPAGGGIWGIDLPETYPEVIILVAVETDTWDEVSPIIYGRSPYDKSGASSSSSETLLKVLATTSTSAKVGSGEKKAETKKKKTREASPPGKERKSDKDRIVTAGGKKKEEIAPPAKPPANRPEDTNYDSEIIVTTPSPIPDPTPRYPYWVRTHISRVTITCSAWANPPHYNRLLWEGKVSDKPSLPFNFKQVQRLVRALIHGGHFPHTGDYRWIAEAEPGTL